MSVCTVCVWILHLFHVCGINYRIEINFFGLVSDYSLITYQHIFVYERAELSFFSVDRTYIIPL